ncbi:MAG: cation-translocating P-type ATPase [Pseudomonadales bacterium]
MNQSAKQIPTDPMKVKIRGMDCGSCAITIEDSIRKLPGVQQASVSFTTESMEVTGDVGIEQIESRLKELGYKLTSNDEPVKTAVAEHRGAVGFMHFVWEQTQLRVSLFVTLAVLVGLPLLSGLQAVLGIEPLDILFTAAVLIAGAPVFIKGMRAIIFAHRITIDLLMIIASIGALAIGATGEAVTVMLLFMLGEGLEAYSAERARDSLRSLMSLQPQEATVLQAHDDSHDDQHSDEKKDCGSSCNDRDDHKHAHEEHDHTVILPIEQVAIGDRVLVRPGERIAVDGEIIKGISSINQAPVTGESVPVVKQVGDEVMAGTVNGEAALEVRTTRLASDGTIARIAKLVEQAQAQRSPAERFIDRFARWYTPAVVALAALVVLIPVYGFGQPLLTQLDGTTGWLYRGLAMLIIACPCALVISIPVTVVSGLTRLANLGVLVKGGAQLDTLATIEAIAFDKTGTLTHGKPRVTHIATEDCSHPAGNDEDCLSCDELVTIAASVERSSEHPVAHAIVQSAEQRPGVGALVHADSVLAHPGKGVSGELSGGRKVVVGTGDLFNSSMNGWGGISRHAEDSRSNGNTIMYVAQNDAVIGYIGVQDEVRDISRTALQQLGEMGIYKVMLTGDHEMAAKRVADKLDSIDEVKASLLPADKLEAIKLIRQQHGPVAMVGDGINDAPALATADIGIAMGAEGSAQAMETADVVLMQDDLSDVPMALRVARKSRRIIKQNIALSLGLKLAFLGLAIPGFATLWMAVMADVGATLLVTLNGMRLLRETK